MILFWNIEIYVLRADHIFDIWLVIIFRLVGWIRIFSHLLFGKLFPLVDEDSLIHSFVLVRWIGVSWLAIIEILLQQRLFREIVSDRHRAFILLVGFHIERIYVRLIHKSLCVIFI